MGDSAVELLEQDHRGIGELFERVSSPDEDRPAVLRELVLRLAGHVAVEHAVVLPELEHCGESDATLADDLAQDHQHIHHRLALVERRKANSPDMPDLLNEILELFRAHVQRCQQRLYPELERCLDRDQMDDLAGRLRSADEVVVERPHPHLLSLGPLTGPLLDVAEKLDRVREGEWGGMFTTPNDNSPPDQGRDYPPQAATTPPPWDDPPDGR